MGWKCGGSLILAARLSRTLSKSAPQFQWDSSRMPETMAGPSRLGRTSQMQLLGQETVSEIKYPPSAWTDVTIDDNLVHHLLALYFCWEYPTFASLSKEHFLLDYTSGNERFCSSLLVNAILSVGAMFSDLPQIRTDPEDSATAGLQFFHEAQKLLGHEDIATLPTIQALNIMSLRQASSGNDASGWHYARQAMRMAIDMDLPSDNLEQGYRQDSPHSQAERQVRAATFWGCFTLEQYAYSTLMLDFPFIIDSI
jgi:hypothetical protein